MKIITHEDHATLKKLIGKTFDNSAIACHKEARKGRLSIDDPKMWKGAHSPKAIAVIICDGVSFAIMPNTEFLLAYEKEHK
jgi:hypothetical protein